MSQIVDRLSLVRVKIDGCQSLELPLGNVENTYGYSAKQRPTNPVGANCGTLESDLLQRRDADLNCGTHALFVRVSGGKPQKSSFIFLHVSNAA